MEAQNIPETAPKRKRGEGTGGRFFVLDRGQWEKIWTIPTANRMNLALAYLVLLAGTGADHRMTKWSTNSISDHTGMRKDAARTAIGELLTAKLIERAPTWTATFPHHHITAGKAKAEAEAEVIFLPVGLVTGLTGTDTSILCRMRETGDPLLLRLLIDLYGAVTTDAPFAVALPKMRWYRDTTNGEAAAEKALEMGAHAIWELADVFTRQSEGLERSHYLVKGEKAPKFWDRLQLLEKTGAIYWEPWLCSSATADADPIYPLTPDDKVKAWADLAARQLLTGAAGEREWKSDAHPGTLAVLPVHHQSPAIQYLMRLRIEADTPGRRGAYGERTRIVGHWIEQYDRLAKEAAKGQFSNPLRTQPSKASEGGRPHQGNQGHQGSSRVSNQS